MDCPRTVRVLAIAGLGALSGAAACSPAKSTAPAAQTTAAQAPLWGDLKPVVSVKELMKYMIDPVADNVFNAVGTTVTRQGTIDIEPKTEDDWDKVRTGAVSLAEGAYLLKIRRPFTPPGDENDSAGPDAVELSPAQITAKVERDPVEWNARIEALRNVALEALDVAKRKDVAELWDVGENLEFYRKLQRRLDEFHDQASKGGAAAKPGTPKR